jgi:hypothetical protein
MHVQRSAQGPALDEDAVAPKRAADILLRDAVDADGELQLGRCLYLSMDPTDLADDVDELLCSGMLR